ncbi:hypothetical protein WJX75_001864 [Coccomyxa subellipsoidea]|uniref:Maltase n=1 Tax=Coccomyxa subellipsoidea TaxID=248742 RepID=A0ABR2YV03_9CHLO
MEWSRTLLTALVLSAAFFLAIAEDQCNSTGPRKDCGYFGITSDQCQSKGCCYIPAPPTTGAALLSLPVCFYKNNGDSSYSLNNLAPSADGTAQRGQLSQQSSTQPELGQDLSPLDVSVEYLTPSIMRVKIGRPERNEVPPSIFNSTMPQGSSTPPSNATYAFDYSRSPFSFTVTRAGNTADQSLFTTKGSRLIFKDQYLELTSAVPKEAALYGIGEHISTSGLLLRREGAPLTLWNRDNAASEPDQNTYGSWPFLLDVRPGGATHGVLLMNSHGMDIVLTQTQISYRVIGGVLDFYFFMGPTPHAVLEQLTSIVGRPFMPPYWSMGLMNSKYGYGSVKQMTRVVESYMQAQIPLETFVTDSQYMDKDQDFTFSADYALDDFQNFRTLLDKNGQRWVPILDPPIHIKENYGAYDSGIASGVFVKDITGRPYAGQLWPGATNWPDFMNQRTIDWWQQQIQSVYKQVPLDGVWLDMNEVSNYCSGDVCIDPGNILPANDFQCRLSCAWGPSAKSDSVQGPRAQIPPGIFNPPYAINNANNQMNISIKTLAVTSSHFDGTLEYEAHNLYGLYQCKATAEALRAIRQKRHFIFTRSTFVGSGAYTAHWTGDSASTWQDLRWQVPAVVAPGLVGISFTGADICGFQNLATEELCARWIAVGAWQPLARVHHAQSFQELYRWPAVAEVSRKVLGWRLRAMPYLYTAFYDSHVYGCPIARPLFFTFPSDAGTLALKEQWMMGDALLITPVLRRGANSTKGYFPPGVWYNLYNHSAINTTSGGQNVTVEALVTDPTPIHVLGGNIVPLSQGGMNTNAARSNPLSLLVALALVASGNSSQRCTGPCTPQQGAVQQACGHMYLDGGEELELGSSRDHLLAFSAYTTRAVNATTGQVRLSWPGLPVNGSGACSGDVAWPILDGVVILGTSPADPASFSMQVIGNSTRAQRLDPAMVSFDTAASSLTLKAMNRTLTCGEDLLLSWTGSS